MAKSLRDEFAARVEEFLSHANRPRNQRRITAAGLGLRITGSPTFVYRLRQGKDVTLTTYEKTLDFMERWYINNGYEVE
jgi:hypothetical protein